MQLAVQRIRHISANLSRIAPLDRIGQSIYHKKADRFLSECTKHPMVASAFIKEGSLYDLLCGMSDLDFLIVFKGGLKTIEKKKLICDIREISRRLGMIPIPLDIKLVSEARFQLLKEVFPAPMLEYMRMMQFDNGCYEPIYLNKQPRMEMLFAYLVRLYSLAWSHAGEPKVSNSFHAYRARRYLSKIIHFGKRTSPKIDLQSPISVLLSKALRTLDQLAVQIEEPSSQETENSVTALEVENTVEFQKVALLYELQKKRVLERGSMEKLVVPSFFLPSFFVVSTVNEEKMQGFLAERFSDPESATRNIPFVFITPAMERCLGRGLFWDLSPDFENFLLDRMKRHSSPLHLLHVRKKEQLSYRIGRLMGDLISATGPNILETLTKLCLETLAVSPEEFPNTNNLLKKIRLQRFALEEIRQFAISVLDEVDDKIKF